jgi:hypothetical protein
VEGPARVCRAALTAIRAGSSEQKVGFRTICGGEVQVGRCVWDLGPKDVLPMTLLEPAG